MQPNDAVDRDLRDLLREIEAARNVLTFGLRNPILSEKVAAAKLVREDLRRLVGEEIIP
jgi:hypothetical protein